MPRRGRGVPEKRARRNRPRTRARSRKSHPTKPARRRRRTRAARVLAARTSALLKLKGALAAEPSKDRDPAKLSPEFRRRLQLVLKDLAMAGTPFKFDEGYRTVDRQQWLYGSGRPTVVPYGRRGPIVTRDDGVRARSRHQGDGPPGTGRAADCYPDDGAGQVIWPPPPPSDPRWQAYADCAVRHGLTAGYYWSSFKDVTHCQFNPGRQR
jgi:hypothetical protein